MHRTGKILLLSFVLLAWGGPISQTVADEQFPADSEFGRYEAELNAVLRTRLEEEKAFVHETLVLVHTGRLPRRLVDRAMVWVRNHCSEKSHAFVYFERVLRLQADKLGFDVPEFDYRVYDRSNSATIED
jgi:hypothetical protein